MKFRLFVVFAFCLIPIFANAQERATIDVNYIGGGFNSTFSYPHGMSMRSGKKYNTDGIDVAAKVRVTDVVMVGYRYQHEVLRNAESFDRSVTNGVTNSCVKPDLGHNGGAVGYQEFFGSFALPKTHGHALVVGVAHATLDRKFRWDTSIGVITSEYSDSYVGVVIGGEGKQKLGTVTFDYSARAYPHLNRTIGNGSGERSSSGYELRGTATWSVAKHVGLTGGYEVRRISTKIPDPDWPINENQTDKKFIVGLRLSF